jgi:hypothetical protein
VRRACCGCGGDVGSGRQGDAVSRHGLATFADHVNLISGQPRGGGLCKAKAVNEVDAERDRAMQA